MADEEIERRVERLLRAIEGLRIRSTAISALDEAIDRDDVPAFDEHHVHLVAGDNKAQTAWAELGMPLDPWPPARGEAELLAEIERLMGGTGDADVAQRMATALKRLKP